MEHRLPSRKEHRLKSFDYSTPGEYFLTICTYKKNNLFWEIPSCPINDPQDVHLTKYGVFAKEAIDAISKIYPAVAVEAYVIMPNHIHLLLRICTDENANRISAPKIETVIRQLKRIVSKKTGHPIWQKSFYDHIVRTQIEHDKIFSYIYENPMKWHTDNGDMLESDFFKAENSE